MSTTVLIGPPEHLPTLQERHNLGKTDAFSDTDALRALDAITRERPTMVAIERGFAATSRGATLIERVKADPRLTACEIRVVAYDSDYARVSPRSEEQASAVLAAVAPGPAVVHAVPPAVAPLDQRGTRRAPRVRVADGVEVRIDGNKASLVDLSPVGAQVISPTILKPNQRVSFTLAGPTKPARCRAVVAWASLELPQGVPHYRAGIEFFDADQAAVTRFIEAHKK